MKGRVFSQFICAVIGPNWIQSTRQLVDDCMSQICLWSAEISLIAENYLMCFCGLPNRIKWFHPSHRMSKNIHITAATKQSQYQHRWAIQQKKQDELE